MGWNDGAMDDPGGWTVIYPGRAAHHPQDIQDRSREPYKAGKVGRYRIYRHSHALAIYDPGKNRHAWIYNAGWDEDGFKTDRWERIVGLTESDDGNLVLEINRGVVTNTVVLTLP